jgi:lipopolysaccharide export system permease protein
MLFDSSLRKELARSFGGTLVIILTIVLTMMLIRTVSMAAGGEVSPQDVALLLGYSALGHLPTMLCLSLFFAIVSTLTRLYHDSEMAVWLVSGVSLLRFLPPLLRFATPIWLVLVLLGLVIWPWSNRQIVDLRDRYEQRSDLSRVAPGQFQISGNGRRVFFIDSQSTEVGNSHNIFVLDTQPQRESVTTARAGRLETSLDGTRTLVLEQGSRADLDLKSGDRTLANFGEQRLVISEKALTRLDDLPPKVRGSLELLASPLPGMRAELAWRLGLVLSAINLLLLAVGLAAGNPRRGNSWTLLLALLTFTVYLNMLNLSQAWVASSRLTLGGALGGLHGSVLVLALLLLWWRDRGSAWLGVSMQRQR